MSQKELFVTLLLLHYTTTTSVQEIHANCPEQAVLECTSDDLDTWSFLSVSWYKLHSGTNQGIIRKGKGESKTTFLSPDHKARFGENYSLLLPSVTPDDSGTYECAISAKLGGRNQHFKVNLIVNACATQADLTTQLTTANLTNTTNWDQLHNTPAEELPVMWTAIIYLAVALTKVILSLIAIRLLCA